MAWAGLNVKASASYSRWRPPESSPGPGSLADPCSWPLCFGTHLGSARAPGPKPRPLRWHSVCITLPPRSVALCRLLPEPETAPLGRGRPVQSPGAEGKALQSCLILDANRPGVERPQSQSAGPRSQPTSDSTPWPVTAFRGAFWARWGPWHYRCP